MYLRTTFFLIFLFGVSQASDLPAYYRKCEQAAIQIFSQAATNEKAVITNLYVEPSQEGPAMTLKFRAEMINSEGVPTVTSLRVRSHQGPTCALIATP